MEIGSEYPIEDNLIHGSLNTGNLSRHFDFLGKSLYLLSGRTAIDCICLDLLQQKKIRTVYMPSYCCSSMQAPFERHHISIDFYDIEYVESGLKFLFDVGKQVDVLYLNNYFGFRHEVDIDWIKKIKKEGTIIIYDKTHSLFMSDDPWDELADYVFCSLRKWFAITSGSVVSKRAGDWNIPILKDCPFVDNKRTAQQKKYQYLKGNPSVTKESFYSQFGVFDTHLKEDYTAYKMDSVSLNLLSRMDFDDIKARRRNNAQFYYEELRGVKSVCLMFKELSEGTVPLFIPVLANSFEQRAEIKKQLVRNQLYCPSHWPKGQHIAESMKVNLIYDTEISLICDQRYTSSQLKKITQLIKTF